MSFLLMMAVTLLITIQNTNSVKHHSQNVLNTQMPQMVQLMHLDLQLFQSLNHINEFLITGDQQDRQRFLTSLEKLNQQSATPALIKSLEPQTALKLGELLFKYSEKARQVINLRENDEDNYKGVSAASELLNPYHLQYIALLDSIISNRFEEDFADSQMAMRRLINTRNSWMNMIMSLRVYFTTRGQRDYERIFLYQEQNIQDMGRLLEIKDEMGFDALFVDQLADLHKTWMSNLPEVLAIYQTEQWRMDTYVIRNDIYPITSQLSELIESLLENQKQITSAESDLLTSELDDLTAIFKSAFAVSFLISLLVIYVVGRNIRSMVEQLDMSHKEAIKRSELLQQSSYELAQSLDKLQTTQSQLIEHEKNGCFR